MVYRVLLSGVILGMGLWGGGLWAQSRPDPAMERRTSLSEGVNYQEVSEEVRLIEEKTLQFNASMNPPADPGGEPSNGFRLYAFTLKPKEKLEVKLKAESSNRIGMTVLGPSKKDGMASEYFRLSRMPKTLRSSYFEIQNITEAPYQVMLMVHGSVHHWYRLHLKRSF